MAKVIPNTPTVSMLGKLKELKESQEMEEKRNEFLRGRKMQIIYDRCSDLMDLEKTDRITKTMEICFDVDKMNKIINEIFLYSTFKNGADDLTTNYMPNSLKDHAKTTAFYAGRLFQAILHFNHDIKDEQLANLSYEILMNYLKGGPNDTVSIASKKPTCFSFIFDYLKF